MECKSKFYTRSNGQQLVYECKYIADRKSQKKDPPEYDDADAINYLINIREFPIVGNTYMVATETYIWLKNTNYLNKQDFILFTADNHEGWDNLDRTTKYYHGWRGTTDAFYIYGEGVRKCIAAYVTGNRSKTIHFIFGNDLKEDED